MFRNLKITTAQSFVFHTLLSILVGGLGTAGMTLGQVLFSGNFNLQLALASGVSAFVAWFLHGFVSLEGNPQFAQSILDSIADVKTLVTNAQVVAPQPAQLPVVINNHLPAQAVPVTPVVQPVVQPAPLAVDLMNTQAELEALKKVQ